MKIVLVKAINFSHQVVPPISLGFIASTARKKGFNNIKILDCLKENMSFEDFKEYVKKEKPDVMGFQIFSYDLEAVKKHLKILKKFSPKTIAVGGGVHPTAEPKQTMEYLKDMDYVITGEAEYSFCSFLKELSKGHGTISEKEKKRIPGLCWKSKKEVVVNAFNLPEDLDEIENDFVKPFNIPVGKVILMPEGRNVEVLREHSQAVAEYAKNKGYRLLGRLQIELWGDVRKT